MPNTATDPQTAKSSDESSQRGGKNHSKMIVCLDEAPVTEKVFSHATAIADALGSTLSLVHVIESDRHPHAPMDPVEWDMRRRQGERLLARFADRVPREADGVQTDIREGRPAEQICDDSLDDITALCRSRHANHHYVGGTARRVLEQASGSVLLVPATAPLAEKAAYSKILVPLDGSARAESAIPYAIKIAAHYDGELVLAHSTATPEMLQTEPPTIEDVELREKLISRNERVAREYLEKVRARLDRCGVTVSTLVLKGGDVRRQILRAISDQRADLLILSAHGTSGFADVPAGDVSSFVIERSTVPVLMVRRVPASENGHAFSQAESRGVRRPAGSVK